MKKKNNVISRVFKGIRESNHASSYIALDKLFKALNDAEKRESEKRAEKEKKEKERADAHVQAVTSMELPLDWQNTFCGDEKTQGVHVDSISDGLILSLSNLGRVDIEYISAITGETYKDVIANLKGAIYQNPNTWGECFFQGWETAEEYLSGNLAKKWDEAQKANVTYNGYFQDNIHAIEAVLPNSVATEDIYITLGSPWVPTDIIDDFIEHLLGQCPSKNSYSSKNWKTLFAVRHDKETGSWAIPEKKRYRGSVAVTNTYGTSRMEALYIMEKTLNMKTIAVYDSVASVSHVSGKKKILNKEETVAALEKQDKMIESFQQWVWLDPNRKQRLERIFEEQYSCVRRRMFDGSFLEFPGLSSEVQLYPYQKNAVARILFSPNTLLAHDVGSGKTYVMIAAGMELKRMGLSQKNLYVVPNNIVGQWKSIYQKMYPQAKLLCVEPRNFKPEQRRSVLRKIQDEEFDGIIMAYSCFEQIEISSDYIVQKLKEKEVELKKALSDISKRTSKVERKKKQVDEAINNLWRVVKLSYDEPCFDELGITRLFVDEAHNFKNVPIDTQINHVLGINRSGSKKCQEMMDKVNIVQRSNGGGGVVMATGTPITNSITDAFVFQKYLQNGELAVLDLQHFDSWVGMFAEKSTNFEVDVDTSSYRMATRFTKFHNLPELTALLSSFADFHQVDKENGIPDFEGYRDCVLGKTSEFATYLKQISSRTDDVRKGIVNRKDDNMLKITTDGRKAALDMRLVEPKALFSLQSKVARCAENIVDYYQKSGAEKGTQLVFCDTSTPKSGFNMYDELKSLLLSYGIPQEEIAYIHDATTERRRAALFGKVRKGEIRVLVGSTFKLGLGVNVQDKLLVVHHLDVPWRPADMVQREGRILRQGNQNEKVDICRYITEGSFDAYSWQLLETKQRFIADLLSGTVTERSGTDIEDTVLNYAEVKALAVGNPLIKERVEVANELSKYGILQRNLVENRLSLQKELKELPGQISHLQERIEVAKKDAEFYQMNKCEHEKEERKALREQIFPEVMNNLFEIHERELLEYQGFQIVLPANMKREKPYVWLKREGKYYVELGDAEIGVLIRIDNFLENFEKYIQTLSEKLDKLQKRKRDIEEELAQKDSYTVQIEDLKQKLSKIDQQLGVA